MDKNQTRGMPKSGRFWKTKKEKFKSIRTIKKSTDLHKKYREEIKRIKEKSKVNDLFITR